jgi:hypothetical protein
VRSVTSSAKEGGKTTVEELTSENAGVDMSRTGLKGAIRVSNTAASIVVKVGLDVASLENGQPGPGPKHDG